MGYRSTRRTAGNAKIIEFPLRSEILSTCIMQRDLIEERFLTNESYRIFKTLNAKRQEIYQKLAAGAPIEAGNHDARLSAHHRRDGSITFSLVVR